jgi:hypothetical protein
VSCTTVFALNDALHTPDVPPLLTVQFTPLGVLITIPLPREPGPATSVSVAAVGALAKPAPTVVMAPEIIVALHELPAHAPLNPLNVDPSAATACSSTETPAANADEHTPPRTPAVTVHAIPSGTLAMLPDPVPKPEIAILPGGSGTRYVTSTVRCPLIATVHGLPLQTAPHVLNTDDDVGVCVSVTIVPIGKLALHAPLPGAVPFNAQSMPAGVLTMRPPPTDVALAITDRKFGTKVAVIARGVSIVV